MSLHRHPRPPLRRWLPLGLGGLALIASAVVTAPILSGRTSRPELALETARRAYAEAVLRDAAHWVPESLAVSAQLLEASLTESRRQAARLLPLRNYASSRRLLEQAERHAWSTARAALARRRAVQKATTAGLRLAAERVAMAREFGALMPLTQPERQDLSAAQLGLQEAQILLQQGKLEPAARLGARAESLATHVAAGCAARAGRYADLQQLERWKRMRDETVGWSRRSGRAAIVISKAAHTLTLYEGGAVKRRYDVDLGTNSVAAKTTAGDRATPEGSYRIVAKKDVGRSLYHKALLLDYPSAADRAENRKRRRAGVSTAGPGGQIAIHGEGGLRKDWTRGCVALTNAEMDELFAAVRIGTPVLIVGSQGDGGPLVDLVQRFRDTLPEERP